MESKKNKKHKKKIKTPKTKSKRRLRKKLLRKLQRIEEERRLVQSDLENIQVFLKKRKQSRKYQEIVDDVSDLEESTLDTANLSFLERKRQKILLNLNTEDCDNAESSEDEYRDFLLEEPMKEKINTDRHNEAFIETENIKQEINFDQMTPNRQKVKFEFKLKKDLNSKIMESPVVSLVKNIKVDSDSRKPAVTPRRRACGDLISEKSIKVEIRSEPYNETIESLKIKEEINFDDVPSSCEKNNFKLMPKIIQTVSNELPIVSVDKNMEKDSHSSQSGVDENACSINEKTKTLPKIDTGVIKDNNCSFKNETKLTQNFKIKVKDMKTLLQNPNETPPIVPESSNFDEFNILMTQQLALTVAQRIHNAMGSSNLLTELTRTFSDTILQSSSRPAIPPLLGYSNTCFVPCRTAPNVRPTIHTRTCSAGDVSEVSENFLQNVGSEMKRLKNFRKWKEVEKAQSSKFIFTLMSYNVLAQCLLNQHQYLYINHDRRALLWEQRKMALMREFQEHNADILCLQEVEKAHLSSFYSQLQDMGYKGIYKKRTGPNMKDGCAIYYKTSMFDLIEHTSVEYFQKNTDLLDRQNIAIIARFRQKTNPSKQFVVATTHLLFNPKRQDIRLAQTQLLLTEIDRIAFDKSNNKPDSYVPIIITGDFNLQPYTPPYQLIVNGVIDYRNLTNRNLNSAQRHDPRQGNILITKDLRITDNCQHADLIQERINKQLTREEEFNIIKLEHSEKTRTQESQFQSNTKHFSTGRLKHNLKLKSVYPHRRFNSKDGMEASTYQDQWVTVDYIFYSNLKLLARYQLPTVRDCKQLPQIPNLVFGSDHLALLAKFALNED